jgi:FAD/FMN-containing dehydrogenase
LTIAFAPLERALAGEVLRPGSPEYEAARRPPIALLRDLRPQAIVRCRTAADVAQAIEFGRACGLEVVPRSGGHCFGGRSSKEGLLVGGVHVFGALSGTEAEARALLGAFVERVGTDLASARLVHGPYREAKRRLAESGPGEETEGHVNLSKSEFFRRPLPADAIDALVRHARDTGVTLDFSPWGGAYNRVRPDATAFPHRAERFLLKHDVAIAPGSPAREPLAALRHSWELVHPWGSGGAYVNFPDPDLDAWDPVYHGSNRERLLRVKATYDPDGVFA